MFRQFLTLVVFLLVAITSLIAQRVPTKNSFTLFGTSEFLTLKQKLNYLNIEKPQTPFLGGFPIHPLEFLQNLKKSPPGLFFY